MTSQPEGKGIKPDARLNFCVSQSQIPHTIFSSHVQYHTQQELHQPFAYSSCSAGASPSQRYTTEQNPSFALRDEEQSRQIAHAAPPHVQGKSTFSSERPLDVKPTTAGGVAIGGCSDLSMGRAGLGDKMIGKTQKVVGKVTNNSEMHEKGELRESGAKAAAHKEARVAHD